MKAIGVILIILGGLGLVFALKMDTTVYVPGQTVSVGQFSQSIPSQTVNNLGLMDERRNAIIISGLVILAGCIFTGLGAVVDQLQPAKPPGEQFDHFIPAKRPPSAPKIEEDEFTTGEKVCVGCVGFAAILLASWFAMR